MGLAPQDRKFFWWSCAFHLGLLLVFAVEFEPVSSLVVVENTHHQDVISAIALGDTEKSRILPREIVAAKPIAPPAQNDKKKLAETKPAIKTGKKTVKKMENKVENLLKDIQKVSHRKEPQQKKIRDQFEKLLKEQAEKTMRQQLLKEKIRLAAKQLREAQGEVNKYKALILQAIGSHWIVPTQANRHLTCELMIRTAPSGRVIDVQVTKTSGDRSLDSSARAAVLKASPLPVPTLPEAFKSFRQFVLKVKPENILE